MFDHFVWSVLAVPPLMVTVVWFVAGQVRPAAGARLLAWSAGAAAIASTLNLLVFSLKAVAETPVAARWFGWSSQIVVADTAHVPWVPWLSLLLLAYAIVAMCWIWAGYRRTLARQALIICQAQGGDVVLAEEQRPLAFTIPGNPGRILISTGMRDALTARQFEALLAHERTHLEQGHSRLVLVSRLAAAAHPTLWWVAKQVEYLVERAADEKAAQVVGSRRLVAQAIGTAALVTHGRQKALLHLAAGRVPRRVSALLNAIEPHRPVLQLLPAALAAASVIWTGEAIYDLGELLVLASRGSWGHR